MSNTTPSSGQEPERGKPGEQPGSTPQPPYPGQGSYGTPPPGAPQFGGNQYGGGQQGGGQYGTPQYGTPGYGAPGYGAPGNPFTPAPTGPKGLAIAALVCGIIAFATAWIPVINIVALIAGLIAIVLGIVSLAKKFNGKVMAGIGMGLGVLGLLGALLMITIFAALTSTVPRAPLGSDPLKSYNEERNKEVSVKYVVTTTGAADARYSTPTGSSDVTVSKDFTKEFTAKASDSFRVSANSADYKDANVKISCEIIIDGQSVSKETGEGKSASSSCYYYKSFSRYSTPKPSKDVTVEFKVTANGKADVDSRWSASGGSGSSSRALEVNKDTTTTVQAKSDGSLSLNVRGRDSETPNPSFGCEILVDGKSVSKQESTSVYGSARCTYRPED
ncbi:hypothetical protein [Arthrobacter sp. NPDC090010]|uniref:DUF4190 domain-containing protein n=1 Tax=Arthrobacter sp. NPDC090010 TaxID=3363942 RepID=UPI0038178CF9